MTLPDTIMLYLSHIPSRAVFPWPPPHPLPSNHYSISRFYCICLDAAARDHWIIVLQVFVDCISKLSQYSCLRGKGRKTALGNSETDLKSIPFRLLDWKDNTAAPTYLEWPVSLSMSHPNIRGLFDVLQLLILQRFRGDIDAGWLRDSTVRRQLPEFAISWVVGIDVIGSVLVARRFCLPI